VWGSGEVGKWGEGRINRNNLLSPVSESPVSCPLNRAIFSTA
jgi:hypothetical protein